MTDLPAPGEPILAAGDVPGYLGPVAALMAAAAVIGYLTARARVVPIVGFLVAGVLLGPAQLGVVENSETVQAAADIGVILLLFTIGIEFSLERLAQVWIVVALAEAGADHVVDLRHVSGQVLAQAVLAALGHTEPGSTRHRTVVDTARVVRCPWPDTGRCEHVDASRPVLARAPGCVTCLRAGADWVHLRICLSCGHVGCCDDSPNRHAREHAHNEDHPLVASAEPEETWGYCFVDDVTVPAPAGATPRPG